MFDQRESETPKRLSGCHLQEARESGPRCQYFVSIFEARDAFRKGDSGFLRDVPEVGKVIATLSKFPDWRVPIYTPPDAVGVCLNSEALSRRDVVGLRVTTVEEGTADDLRRVLGSPDEQVGRGLVKVLQEEDGQGRPLRRTIAGPEGQVSVFEKEWLVKVLDIGCYHPSQESFDRPKR